MSKLSSFPYIDFRILERHNQLEETIGALDMEVEAFKRARLLSWMLFPLWIFLSVVQAICFALGNGDFHPLHSIIDSHDDKDEGTSDKVFMIKNI